MALQVLVKEFVGYSALFLRTIEGKPTCPQYHKLDPYKSCLVLISNPSFRLGSPTAVGFSFPTRAMAYMYVQYMNV